MMTDTERAILNIETRVLQNDLYIQLLNGRRAQVIDVCPDVRSNVTLVLIDVEEGTISELKPDSDETRALGRACERGARLFVRSNS